MAAAQIATQNIGGMTYYDDGNGNLVDYLGRPAPGQPQDNYTNSAYEQGVTAQSLIDPTVTNTYNPTQLATQQTTDALSKNLGLKEGQTVYEGPGVPSTPIRSVGASNAGLAQDTLNRYGDAPGSYGRYLIDRDQPGQGDPGYGGYYNSAPVQSAIKAAQPASAPGSGSATGTQSPMTVSRTATGFAPATGDYTGSISGNTPTTRGPGGSAVGAPPIQRWQNSSPLLSSTTQPPTGGTTQPPATQPNTPGTTAPPYTRTQVQGPGIPQAGAPGSQQAPNAGYAPRAAGSFRSNPSNGYQNVAPMYTQQDTPEHKNEGEGLQYKTENDRALELQRGEELNADLGNYTDQQNQDANDFSDLQGAAYSGIAAGQGGRSADEKNAILRQGELDSLQQTPEEAQQNYLTDAEQAGIKGDTERGIGQLGRDEAGIDAVGNGADANIRGELYAERDRTNEALNAQDASVRNSVAGQKQNTRAALQGEANNARSYLEPTALNTSADYNQNYNFGDRDAQDLVDRAGRTVGSQSQADEDRLLSDANANGNTSPLALQAARDRIRQTGQVNSADAMTDARIQAKQLALQATQNKENTRLGAAQNYANLGTGTELNLGQDALANEQSLGAAEIGAESYLGDQRTKTQQALGQQSVGVETGIGNQKVDIATKGTDRNLAAYQNADAANSARAGQIATNRQATSEGNQNTQYTRGKAAYDAESAANTDFSNTRLGQEKEYRDTLGTRQAQAAQGTQVGNQQRVGNYGTQTGAVNAAEGNALVNYKVPSSTEKILGGIASVVAGKKGLVTPGPRLGLIGEAGPELEIEVGKLPRYGYGFNPLDEEDPYAYTTGSGETPYEGNDGPGGTVSRNRPNPLWKNIVNTISPHGYQPFKPEQVDDSPNQSPLGKSKQSGGLLRKMITAGMFAEGGVVAPEREEIAPGVNYVNGPQVRRLGENGPTIIAPLQHRKNNRVNLEDVPGIIAEYGNYGGSYAR